MKKYQYVLFDWDGNLAKTLDLWLEALRVPLVRRGLHITDEQISDSFGAIIQHMKQWGVKDPEAALEEADAIAQKTLPDVDLYPDALEVLEKLHSLGKQLALITTSEHVNVRYLLVKHNLNRFFEVIVAGDDVTNHKPHPEPLEKALTALAGSKEQAIIIGDSDKDLGAAQNFGIDSILFYPPEHQKFYNLNNLKELKPTYIVHDLRQVLKII